MAFSGRLRSGSALFCLAAAGLCLTGNAFASDQKLTEQDRVELLRGLSSEHATVKAFLPRSKKPLPYESNGTWDKQKWAEAGQQFGPAARVGDQVEITKVTIEDDKLILEINGGWRPGGHWYDRVQVGMGPNMTPVNGNQSTAKAGTTLAILFKKQMPAMKADEIKKMLKPILDFDTDTATTNYVEQLPEPIQKAIKANQAIEGMDRDQVLLALGKPRHKERDEKDGVETEDWIYGDPPGKITFVTFTGSKVTKIREAYANLGGSTASPPPR